MADVHRASRPSVRRRSDGRSTEATRDVVLGRLHRRVREHRRRVVELDELARCAGARDVEEGGLVADARRLLHVVRDDDDREVLLELLDQVLDGERRDRVERGARLVHEQDVRLHRDRAGDAETLLLTAGQAHAGLLEAVLDLVPQVRALQRALDDVVGLGLRQALVVELHTGQHVVADGHRGERVRALEHHADLAADEHRVDPGAVQVVAVDLDRALDVGAGDDLVHAVERAEEGGLAAARRADEGGDGAGLDRHVDALDGLELRVVDVEAVDLDALGHVVSFGVGWSDRACSALAREPGGEESGDEAGEQVEHHHDEDEHERRGPGPVDERHRVGALLRVLRVGEHRQGHHRVLEQVVVHARGEAGGDEQRRGLTDDAGDREHDARGDAGEARRQDHLEDRQVLRDAEGVRGLAELHRHDLQDLLGGADDHGDHQHAQGDGADEAEAGARTEEEREERVCEEARDDRGDAGHDVDEERDALRQGALAVLDEVDRGEEADRHRDERREERDLERADEGVQGPAALGDDAAHRGAEVRAVEAGDTVGDHGPEERHQRQDGDDEGRGDQRRHEAVDRLAAALDDARDDDDEHVEEDRAEEQGRDDVEVTDGTARVEQGEDRDQRDPRADEEQPRHGLVQLAVGVDVAGDAGLTESE
ncbi:Uncharacterized protein Cus16_2894 [Curtobacterium sp. ER1/6]|nr:Uncharacterized protein Cus16_2894 [Curtobacterium sp. ER1/6]